MTPEDRFAIQDLLARYAWVLDTGDFEAYPFLFTPDGVFEVVGLGEYKGRDALREMAREMVGHAARGNRHHNTQILFEESGDDWCRLRSYTTHIFQPESGGPSIIRRQGWYRDRCLKVDAEWYFAERRWGDWQPESLEKHRLQKP